MSFWTALLQDFLFTTPNKHQDPGKLHVWHWMPWIICFLVKWHCLLTKWSNIPWMWLLQSYNRHGKMLWTCKHALLCFTPHSFSCNCNILLYYYRRSQKIDRHQSALLLLLLHFCRIWSVLLWNFNLFYSLQIVLQLQLFLISWVSSEWHPFISSSRLLFPRCYGFFIFL